MESTNVSSIMNLYKDVDAKKKKNKNIKKTLDFFIDYSS